MNISLLNFTKDCSKLIADAGHTCYSSTAEGNDDRFIRDRIKDGHESIIEHGVATFKISGISRACSHQLVRHRLASYSQASQRFCDPGDWEPVQPPSLWSEQRRKVFFTLIEQSKLAYKQLRYLGMKKEDARYVLPNATPTEIVMTANLREWRHFIKLRCSLRAQWEIREVALIILYHLYMDVCPAAFGDLFKEFLIDNEENRSKLLG